MGHSLGAGIVALALLAAPKAAVAAEDSPALQLELGLGVDFIPSSDYPGSGDGGFGSVEYVAPGYSWLTPRAYAGLQITTPHSDSCGATPCDVSSKVFFAGGKVRFTVPIPYVGPFFELGRAYPSAPSGRGAGPRSTTRPTASRCTCRSRSGSRSGPCTSSTWPLRTSSIPARITSAARPPLVSASPFASVTFRSSAPAAATALMNSVEEV